MICVFDFCGYSVPGHFPVSMWADWDGKKVVFGGEWEEVPPWITGKEPTQEQVLKYVKTKQTEDTNGKKPEGL
jgi:hypothetical protein